MTSGSRFGKVDLLRSVGGFYGVWVYSRVFQAPSYCSPGPLWKWVSGCLTRSLLRGDVFLCGLLVCPWCILGGEVVDAQKGSRSNYLVGPIFLGGHGANIPAPPAADKPQLGAWSP
jgi:hypothetical protein